MFQISKFSIYRPNDCLCSFNLRNIKNLYRNINFKFFLSLSYVVAHKNNCSDKQLA